MSATTGTQTVRLLAADDEQVLRKALADLTAGDPRVHLVGMASDADQAIALAGRLRPDVALLDVRMPGGGGPAAARGIRTCSPATRVVAYSAYDDRSSIIEMIRAGAVGYVVKGSADDPINAVVRAAQGERVLSDEAVVEVIGELVGRLESDDLQDETFRSSASRIREAVEGRGLSFVYQPIVDLADGSLAGVESLARFAGEPSRPPDAWFGEAKEVGLLDQLECAAIERTVAGIASIPATAFLSVNISPTTVVGSEFARVSDGLPLNRLVFEITEHSYVEDYPRLRGVLASLQARGARIAVDDAGAGFASLRHIVQMTPSIIKLDLGLVRGVDVDPARRALAAGLASFARDVGAAIVAEGIESPDELRTLRGLGVGYGQGYCLARPGGLPPPMRYPVSDRAH